MAQPLRVAGSTRRLRWFLDHAAGTVQLAHLLRPGVRAPWRCVVIVESDLPDSPVHTGPVVGLDLGISNFLTLSNGEVVKNPRLLSNTLRRLHRAQKSVSRSEQVRRAQEIEMREAGTLAVNQRIDKSRRHIAKDAVVARIHARVTALRSEFHYQTANDLVSRFSAIGIEDLNIAGMKRNRSLARSISDVGWASFLRVLDYKADAAGVEIIRADRWFPSSQRCSNCGAINKAVKSLKVRSWTCLFCEIYHDRDHNSARNLFPSAQQIALARSVRLAAPASQAKKRQAQKDKAAKATITKEAKRLAKHQERLARHASSTSLPVAVTQTETQNGSPALPLVDPLNARGGPMRPKRATRVAPAVARTASLTSGQKETRIEQSGLPTFLIDSGRSLGAPDPPSCALGV